MIRKIKTGVNGENRNDYKEDNQQHNSNQSYDIESKNAQVEEFNLDSFSSNNSISNQNVITEEAVLNAIQENFSTNRNATNDMNKQIFNVFIEKVNQFASSNGGDI